MKTGICSITLRQMSPAELVKLVAHAGLESIEWGSDVHVPPGDLKLAENVRDMTVDAGLDVSSYGSYWKVVDAEGAPSPFEPVLESALALGTDVIRVWAGHHPSDAVTELERETIYRYLRDALEASAKAGVKLGLEFHANTLSDSNGATMKVLKDLNHPSLFTYWQPVYWLTDPQYRIDGLKDLAGEILNMHVFHWLFRPGAGSWGDSTDRRPLEEGATDWKSYFSIPLDPTIEHYALMEFVRDDDPDQVRADAAVLKHILEGVRHDQSAILT